MNENEKQTYLEKYQQQKKKGIFFFPDALFKDAVVSLGILLVLIGLSYFLGAPLEERANPSDSSYNPKPEWYFLFLFQLLKYFPGELEVIGVVVIPTLAILALFLLPFLDRNPKRHFVNRKGVTITTLVGIAAIIILSVLSVVEAPPPAEAAVGDVTAALYTQNCAGCHGPTINVPAGTNLHDVIAKGDHEGMPPWSADLTNDQIDSLVGFILSPSGNILFTQNCSTCHEATELVGIEPLEIKQALDEEVVYPDHTGLEIPPWSEVMSSAELTSLLNFLVAPDGQRLFVSNCSSCHGVSVAFSGDAEELHETISEGGLHLEMPAWQGTLDEDQINLLANYVLDPAGKPEGVSLYQENCTSCHFERVPVSDSFDTAYQEIAFGGSHETMPLWGQILTVEQLDALVGYTLETSRGTSTSVGRDLYVQNCASCHGDFGEGGPNPARQDDVIAPISTSEYLKTRDNVTLKAIISQGQPNFGMSPFSISSGGPLDEPEIEALVAYIRSWEANPPVELPPEVDTSTVALSGSEIYQSVCAQCHGADAAGGVAPSLRSSAFRSRIDSQTIFDSVNLGHEATPMIAWGEILTSSQIDELVTFILSLPQIEDEASGEVSFAAQVKPIFDNDCLICHNDEDADGGWNAATYDQIINSGDHAPVILPGEADTSLLVLKLLNTQTEGEMMPPFKPLDEASIQIILDWIAAGAPNN